MTINEIILSINLLKARTVRKAGFTYLGKVQFIMYGTYNFFV